LHRRQPIDDARCVGLGERGEVRLCLVRGEPECGLARVFEEELVGSACPGVIAGEAPGDLSVARLGRREEHGRAARLVGDAGESEVVGAGPGEEPRRAGEGPSPAEREVGLRRTLGAGVREVADPGLEDVAHLDVPRRFDHARANDNR
jgi:hypothetical protein